MMFFIHLFYYKVYLTALKNSKLKWIVYRQHTVLMYFTAHDLWTFTWFVHFELPFRLKGTEKVHTERFSKFPSFYSLCLWTFPEAVKNDKSSKNFSKLTMDLYLEVTKS